MHRLPSNYSSAAPYDVVIAGADPVGMFIACELRHTTTCRFMVLEHAEDFGLCP